MDSKEQQQEDMIIEDDEKIASRAAVTATDDPSNESIDDTPPAFMETNSFEENDDEDDNHHEEEQEQEENEQSQKLNIARLCSSTRSRCGYCRGDRAHLLLQPNPPRPSSSAASTTDATTIYKFTNKTNSSKSYGLIFDYLTYSDYFSLIDSGWRRSGSHLYKPDNWSSCCPALPIRLVVRKNKGNKKQRRVFGRDMDRALRGGITTDNDKQQQVQEKKNKKQDGMEGERSIKKPRQEQQVKQPPLPTQQNSFPKTKKKQQNRHKKQQQLTEKYFQRIQKTNLHFQIQQQIVTELLENVIPCHFICDNEEQDSSLLSSNKQAKDGASSSPSSPPFMVTRSALEKLCVLKLNKKADKKKTTATVEKEQSQYDSFFTITLSTSICAALSGRSHGKLPKKELLSELLQKLKRSLLSNKEGEERTKLRNTVWLEDIVAHEASGYLHFYIGCCLDNSEDSSEMNVDDNESSSALQSSASRSATATENATSTSSSLPSSSTTGGNSSPLDTCIYNFLSSQNIHGISPPYTLSVRSIPAHISALQSDVHQLFVKYQNAIHGDPDPFLDDLEGGDDDDKKKSGTNGMEVDNDSSTNQTEDGKENEEKENKEDDDDDDDEPIEMPPYFDSDPNYIAYSKEKRNKIKKAYASFHRFLCETPLPYPGDVPPHSSSSFMFPFTTQEAVPSSPAFSSNDSSSAARHHHKAVNGFATSERKDLDQSHDDDKQNSNRFQLDSDGYDVYIPCGTYHQQYRINDKYLIAVGVVDILPKCLSSVYAFYDPCLSNILHLGKYTALREIEWVKRASLYREKLSYYYLGFYIHSCQKMRYKAEYAPSELLCPTHGTWIDFEVAKRKLDKFSPYRHCCTLADENDGDNENNSNKNDSCDGKKEEGIGDLEESIKLDIGGGPLGIVTVGMLNDHGREIVKPLVKEFVSEVGRDVSQRCIVKLC